MFHWVHLFIRYAESVGAQHFLTSAKQNKNLDKVFVELTKRTYCVYRAIVSCLCVWSPGGVFELSLGSWLQA